MAGPVPTYLATQAAAQTAFTVPFGLLTLVNGAITTATGAGQFNATVDCSIFVSDDISNLRIYLDSLGYKVEFAKNSTKSLLIDWSQAIDIDGSSVATVTSNQGTPNTPSNKWPVEIVDAGGVNIAAVDATGDVQVDVRNFPATQVISAVSLPLPTGASTSANQTNGTQRTQIVSGANIAAVDATGDVSVDVNNFPATQAISAVSLPLPTGAATAANQTNGSQAVKLVNGINTAAIAADGSVQVDVGNFPATQPISAVSLPLPAGAATSANQTNGTQTVKLVNGANTAAIDATGDVSVDVNNFPASQTVNGTVTVVQPTGTNLHAVVDSGSITSNIGTTGGLALDVTLTNSTQKTQIVQGGNTAIVDATGDLQADINNFPVLQAVNLTQVGGAVVTEGQKAMASSIPVTIASDQTGGSATLGVSTTGAAGAAVTLTLPAIAADFHYVSHLEIVAYTSLARVGVALPIIVTSTNLPGNPSWDFSTAAAVGTTDRLTLDFEPPIHSSIVNTATTIVCPATTSVIWRVTAFYFAAI